MKNNGRYIIEDREQSTIAESFRVLSATLRDARAENNVQTVLFSTISDGEGAVMTAVNTAVTLAYAGKRVILVDCDMRHPVLNDIFDLEVFGLTNIILQGKPIEPMIQRSGIDRLNVLAAGSVAGGAVELLSNKKLQDVLEQLKSFFDFVIVVSAPLLVGSKKILSDACIVASKVDGVVLVIPSRAVKTQTARKAIELLKGARANIIGTVLSDVKVDAEMVYYSSVG